MRYQTTLLRSCGKGSQEACTIAKKVQVLYAGSVISFSSITSNEGTNKLPFSGTLLILDEPSQKPPHGSQGHRILVHKNVAKNKLSGIIGMAVNYASGLDEHATSHKVGVITKAWIEGNKVMVSGFIWSKDFPDAEKLKGRSDLGMSMELADVYVEDEHSSIWNLEDFDFTGATILKKEAAAYTKTSLAASHCNCKGKCECNNTKSLAAANATRGKGEQMPKHDKDKRKVAAARRDTGQSNDPALLIQAMSGTLTQALQNTVGPLVNEIKASNQALRDDMAEIGGRLRLIEVHAAATDDDEDGIVLTAAKEDDESDEMAAGKEDDESDEMAAAKSDESDESDEDMAAARGRKEDDDSSDDDSSSDDNGSVDAMEDLSLEDASQEPGEVNKDASNRGSKKSVTKPPKQGEHFAGNVAKGRIHSKGVNMKKPFGGMDAAAETIQRLHASNRKLVKTVKVIQASALKDKKRYRTQIKTMNAQLEHFAEVEGRRSVMPIELTSLASKSGIDLRDIKAQGQKLSVEAADTMFANARSLGINIEPKDRIAMKNLMIEQGILDDGVIDRGMGRA